MKIYKWILPLVFLAFILLLFYAPIRGRVAEFTLAGFKKVEEKMNLKTEVSEPKLYQITVYELTEFAKIMGKQESEFYSEMLDYESSTYQATKVIEFNKTAIRFIDKNGREIFETGEKIEVQRIK